MESEIKHKPIVSIIIPIYNVEQYIKDCIDSVLNQTYKNLEIILIDDGSPDNCGKICDEYALKDNRIKVIHKGNGGLSDARNAGLNIASGKYLSFIDSDDIVHPQFIEILLASLLKTNSKISFCNSLKFKEKEEINTNLLNVNFHKKFTGEEFLKLLYSNDWYPKNVTVWNKIYHKDIFSKIRFKKGLVHEDEYIFTDIYSKPNLDISFCNKNLYYYRITPNSIMNSPFSEKRMEGLVLSYKKRISFFKNKNSNNYNISKLKLIWIYIESMTYGLRKKLRKKLKYQDLFFILLDKDIYWKLKIIFFMKLLFNLNIKSIIPHYILKIKK